MTSAVLLKELLQLQKTRQLEQTAEGLPDFVCGTQVGTIKVDTTPDALRTKIRLSRQNERKARLQQLELIIQRKLRQSVALVTQKAADKETATLNSELERRAKIAATFFHEMAMQRSKRQDCAALSATESLEKVWKQAGGLFADSHRSHNKVKSITGTTTKPQDSITLKLPPRTESETDEYPFYTFEDYENTAHYIEQLMMEVSIKATQQQMTQDVTDAERKQIFVKELSASWLDTPHCESKATRLHESNQQRKNQWMQCGLTTRSDKAERSDSTSILPKQQVFVLGQSLESSAFQKDSEVLSNPSTLLASPRVVPACGTVSPLPDIARPSIYKLNYQRPSVQRMTQTTVNRSSRITVAHFAPVKRASGCQIHSFGSTSTEFSSLIKFQSPRFASILASKDFKLPVLDNVPQEECDIELPFLSIPHVAINELPTSVTLCDGKNLIGDPSTDEVDPTTSRSPTSTNILSAVRTRTTVAHKKRLKKKAPIESRFRGRVLELFSILRDVANE